MVYNVRTIITLPTFSHSVPSEKQEHTLQRTYSSICTQIKQYYTTRRNIDLYFIYGRSFKHYVTFEQFDYDLFIELVKARGITHLVPHGFSTSRDAVPYFISFSNTWNYTPKFNLEGATPYFTKRTQYNQEDYAQQTAQTSPATSDVLPVPNFAITTVTHTPRPITGVFPSVFPHNGQPSEVTLPDPNFT